MRTEAFLLTRQWRDAPNGVELTYWAASDSGPLRLRFDRQQAVAFISRDVRTDDDFEGLRKTVEMRGLDGTAVDAVYFDSRRQLAAFSRRMERDGASIYESDLKPSERFLMERFLTGGIFVDGKPLRHERFTEFLTPRLQPGDFRPTLRWLSVDIETDGVDGSVLSVAASRPELARVFLLDAVHWSPGARGDMESWATRRDVELSVHRDEQSLLKGVFAWLRAEDPDAIIGWNVIDFDLSYLMRRARIYGQRFEVGRGDETATILPPSGPGQKHIPRIPGRLVLDGIDTLKNATWNFEDFSLESVGRQVLGRGKRLDTDGGDLREVSGAERIRQIRRLYREAPADLLEYNLEDCRLVEGIFQEAKLLDFAISRAQLTGLAADRIGGSVAAFDNLYLPRMHRRGFVAPAVASRSTTSDLSPGGYVFDSEPGLFDNVLVLDFKSLYPSIIRTFNVDPVGLVEPGDDAIDGFRGGRFARGEQILPGLIERLWSEREQAKRRSDAPLSQAIKILMNSFYGVLGTPACRFFDARLASSITMRGHQILSDSKTIIEDLGHRVIYGDTDSLFVLADAKLDIPTCQRLGTELADSLNQNWRSRLDHEQRLESFLEIEFETLYRRFFMPTIRGSELGSKKRYAGLAVRKTGERLEFTGLECVRSDWTPLAREFQREIFRRIFADESFEDYVKEVAAEMMGGRRDRDLVYRKRLGRSLGDYKKNVPPHAQAARKSKEPGRWIRYVITSQGPEPLDNNPSPLDYQHYLDRQLAPAGDTILQVKGTSVEKILDRQMSLF